MNLENMTIEELLTYMQSVWLYGNDDLKEQVNEELRKRGQNV